MKLTVSVQLLWAQNTNLNQGRSMPSKTYHRAASSCFLPFIGLVNRFKCHKASIQLFQIYPRFLVHRVLLVYCVLQMFSYYFHLQVAPEDYRFRLALWLFVFSDWLKKECPLGHWRYHSLYFHHSIWSESSMSLACHEHSFHFQFLLQLYLLYHQEQGYLMFTFL